MSENNLDKLIKEYYNSQSLSESSIQRILENTPEKDNVVPFYRATWFSYAAAACIAFAVVMVGLNFMQPVGDSQQIAGRVVEIYDRHLNPDVFSSDLDSIEQVLQPAGFSIMPSSMETIRNYSVVGGRNCGIKGVKAVHVVLTNTQTGMESCLYIMPDNEALSSLKNKSYMVGNQPVKVWRDGNRIFALYDPSN